jgi:periplasmic protein CpxP/Spy
MRVFERGKEELKNSMRNKLFALALGGMIAVSANAALYAQDNSAQTTTPQTSGDQQPGQSHRGQRMDPDRQLAHLSKTLDLTADQQAQIKPILQDRQQKMQTLWQDQSLSRQDKRMKAQAIQQDSQTKLEAALNDQQKQKFEEMRAKMQARRQQRMGGQNQAPGATPQPE